MENPQEYLALTFNCGITYSKAQNKAQKGTFPFEPIHFIR